MIIIPAGLILLLAALYMLFGTGLGMVILVIVGVSITIGVIEELIYSPKHPTPPDEDTDVNASRKKKRR